MPIKPKPFMLVCEDCNWKKAIAPRSDALRPGECFFVCPWCGGTDLKMREAGWLEAIVVEVMARRGL